MQINPCLLVIKFYFPSTRHCSEVYKLNFHSSPESTGQQLKPRPTSTSWASKFSLKTLGNLIKTQESESLGDKDLKLYAPLPTGSKASNEPSLKILRARS